MRHAFNTKRAVIILLLIAAAVLIPYFIIYVIADAGKSCYLPNYLCACGAPCQGPHEEINNYNTLDGCQDGVDESIFEYVQEIIVTGFNDTLFKGGDTIEALIQFKCYAGDPISIVYSNDSQAGTIVWRNIYDSACGSASYGFEDFKVNVTLDTNSGMHAIRGIISYPGSPGLTCGQDYGSSDTDDITFWVNSKPDYQPPNLIIYSPANGATYEKVSNLVILLNITATDENNVSYVKGNLTWTNNTLNFTLNKTGLTSYEFNFTNLTEATKYNMTIVSKDSLNNTGTNKTFFYIINNASLDISLPALGTTYNSHNITLDFTINDGKKPYSRVYYKLNNGNETNLTTSENINVTLWNNVAYFSNEETNLSQSFTPNRTIRLDYILLPLKKNSSGTVNITLEIRSNSGNAPSSAILATGKVDSSIVSSGTFDFVNFTLNQSVQVVSGTKYWMFINNDTSYIYWQAGNETNYTDGEFLSDNSYDLLFTAYDRARYILALNANEGGNTIEGCEINNLDALECTYVAFTTDTIPPSYSALSLTGDPFELGNLYQFISLSVTDATSGISKVKIETNRTANQSMDYVSGSTYRYRWTINKIGTYYYMISFNDTAGNFNQTQEFNFSVADTRYPVIANYNYVPQNPLDLDPNVTIIVNATITDDSTVLLSLLQYKQSNDTIWNNVTMSNISTHHNASFVPSSEGIWNYRIYSADIYNNSVASAQVNISVFFDYSWEVYPSQLNEIYLTQGSEAQLGNITINNTADIPLNFSLSKLSGTPLVYFNETSVIVQNNKTYTINISVKAPEESPLPYQIKLKIDCMQNNCTPASQNVSASVAVGQGGPYLTAADVIYDPSVRQGDRNILLNATIKNIGNETAYDASINWTLPDGFVVLANTSKFLGNITPYSTTLQLEYFGFLTSASLLAPVGDANITITLNFYVDANTSRSNIITKTITISKLEIPGQEEPPGGGNDEEPEQNPGGGGGGNAAPSGSGGGFIPQQSYDINLTYPAIVSIMRGQNATVTVIMKNNNEGIIYSDLTLDIEGLPVSRTIYPPSIDYLEYKDQKNFTAAFGVPLYYGYGKYDLNLVLKGKLKKSLNALGNDFTQKNSLLLIISEVDASESLKCLVDSENIIDLMKSNNFSTIKVNKLLNDANNALSSLDYTMVKNICDQIATDKDKAYEVTALYYTLKSKIANASKQGFDTTEAMQLMEIANELLSQGEFSDAGANLENIDTALTIQIQTEEAKLINRLRWLIVNFWWAILLTMAGGTGFGIYSYKKAEAERIRVKLIMLDEEEKYIQQSIVDLQKKYFATKDIGPRLYMESMDTFNTRLAEIKNERISLQNAKPKSFRPADTIAGLQEQKKEIENLILELQRDYFVRHQADEGAYKRSYEIYRKRLAEINIEIRQKEMEQEEAKKKNEAALERKEEPVAELKKEVVRQPEAEVKKDGI